MRVFGLVFCVCLILTGCQDETSQSERFLEACSEIDGFDSSIYDAILVIPEAGCDGCISSSVYFVKDNFADLTRLGVIFTRIGSKKALRARIGTDLLNSPRTHIDEVDYLNFEPFNSIYPLVVYLEDSKVSLIQEQSPYKPATLDSLKRVLIH